MTELKIDEGRIYGARYYTVQPVPSWDLSGDWGNIKSWEEMEKWATEIFGPTPEQGVWVPGQRWYVNNAKFWFRSEEDHTMFILRWS